MDDHTPPSDSPAGPSGVNTMRLTVVLVVIAVFGLITAFLFWLLVAGGFSTVRDEAAASGPGAAVLPASVNVDLEQLSALQVPSLDGFVDHGGAPVGRDVFEDEWTILAFIFTRCPLVCPTTMGNMFQMNQSLGGAPVRFAFMTVDPEHDTPEVMSGYLERQGYEDARRPTALIAPSATAMRDAIEGSFLLTAGIDEALLAAGDADSLASVVHPTRMLLIGPELRIHGMASSQENESALWLAAHAAQLAQGG
ncbi:MAG: SCO family protein [Planctomycetota bacterium]